MVVDRAHRNHEALRDLPVGQAASGQSGDLELAGRQRQRCVQTRQRGGPSSLTGVGERSRPCRRGEGAARPAFLADQSGRLSRRLSRRLSCIQDRPHVLERGCDAVDSSRVRGDQRGNTGGERRNQIALDRAANDRNGDAAEPGSPSLATSCQANASNATWPYSTHHVAQSPAICRARDDSSRSWLARRARFRTGRVSARRPTGSGLVGRARGSIRGHRGDRLRAAVHGDHPLGGATPPVASRTSDGRTARR